MKGLLSILGLLFVAICSRADYPETKEATIALFRTWQAEYGKKYRPGEAEYRFEKFADNLKYINRLNRQHGGETEFAVNQFAAMSPEEFSRTVLMPPRPAPRHPKERYMKVDLPTAPLPGSFDWTNQTKQVVTPVKDQGSVGSCWAFSAIGNVEGQWALANQPLTNLSVEQLVDCDGTEDVNNFRADCGVFGGWPYLAYQYMNKTGGLETEEDYSYCSGFGGAPGTCFPCKAPGFNKTLCGPSVPWCLRNESCSAKLDPDKFVPGLKVVGWKQVQEDETIMADVLLSTGPLSVALDATLLQFYRRGVFGPIIGCGTTINHAVLLVGWGTEKGLLEEKPYWKVKNSWGPKWGMDGYFLIKRGTGECGINTEVTSAILSI